MRLVGNRYHRIVPRLSIVVPVYNRSLLARETLESALAQTFRDQETIVVDDGSEEDVEAALGGLSRRVRLVRRAHGGISAARNTGVREARGELVAFLDSDDLWLPGKCQAQIDLLEARPQLAACFTNHSHFKEGRIVRRRRVDSAFDARPLDLLVARPEVSTSSLLGRRDVLLALGPFDEALERGEDYDLFLKLAALHTIGFIDEPLVLYRIHDRNAANADVLRRNWLEKRVLRRCWNALDLGARVPREIYARRLSNLDAAIGSSLVRAGRRPLARRYFLRSARNARGRVKPYWRWAKSFLGLG